MENQETGHSAGEGIDLPVVELGVLDDFLEPVFERGEAYERKCITVHFTEETSHISNQ